MENFTRTPNNLLDKLSNAKLTATQFNLLHTIIRYTHGFQRQEHNLSLSFLSKATDRDKRQIQRELKDLEERHIIFQKIGSNKRIISINSKYEEWSIGIGKPTNGKPTNGKDTNPGDGKPTNGSIGKPTNQETKKEKSKEREIEEYFQKIWSLYPNQIGKSNITEDQKEKLYNEVPINDMVKAITKYKQEIQGREPRFIKHAGNFFNGDYMDYLPPKGQTIPRPKEIKILDYDDKIRQLQEEEERRYQAR